MSEISELTGQLTSYLKPEDIGLVEEAFRFSEEAHRGQFRKSGEPYVSHPLAVASILAEWHLDPQGLTAALLHDVMEDTSVTKTEIADKFGKAVAELVDGVSKLDRIEFQTQEDAQAENFRKMLLAMARDVRVILIKLADRLHNMRTLDVMQRPQRKRIAQETIDIYAPIANRLGLNNLFQELQELSFRHLYPVRFNVLSKATKAARGNRRAVVEKVLDAIKQRLTEANIEANVTGREKHLYSIYKKMLEKSLSFSQVLDIYGFRVIVKDVPSCYVALGALHGLYKPIPGKFKDYIAIPKANGYQSLHTTLFGPFGTPLEVQIRTLDMHRLAEAGVASHWLYKSHDGELNDVQKRTHQWLQNLLEIQLESGDSVEFLEHVKVDLFPDEVYVFTPKGKIMALPHGATAVDFAYAVHTDVGNHCVAVKINYQLMPLRTHLRNGDRVEIITATNAKPNPTWLNFVATGKSRSHIRHFLKTMQYQESAALGERLLHQALYALKAKPEEISDQHWEKLLKETGTKFKHEILADIGLGKRLSVVVARQLLTQTDAAALEGKPIGPITILGSEGMAVQYAKCCRPIPGDTIVGLIKKGQGLVIHSFDCPSIGRARNDPDKLLDVEWAKDTAKLFEASIKVVAADKRGVLARITSEIAEANSNIENVSMEKADDTYTNIFFTIQVNNRKHLANLMRALRRIPEVARISRNKGSKFETT
jgi:GTP pyrophosphokinase